MREESRLIIGLTGAFGSGASYIADEFLVEMGFKKLSLSSVLKKKYETEKGVSQYNRSDLQNYGNELRKKNPSELAEEVSELIEDEENYVIDSIRNPKEIAYFREKYAEFILIGVFASFNTRWERVKGKYNSDQGSFERDDQKDKGTWEPYYGQKISDCFFESDLVISNEEYLRDKDLFEKKSRSIKHYIKAFKEPYRSNPQIDEILMAESYIIGRMSNCLKRKVGAIIADSKKRVISSGYNCVPIGQKPCASKYKECYRDNKRKELGESLFSSINDSCGTDKDVFLETFKNHVKLLDYCRSLHAEENAIVGLAGDGINLDNSTIYVTTHPCNLCANKIVQSGIKRVVYFEPYPVLEAQEILKGASIESIPFEGVTFRAFFRAYDYEPS
jgi:dCMP deaminase